MNKIGFLLGAACLTFCLDEHRFQPFPVLVQSVECISYTVDPNQQTLEFFWKNQQGHNYVNFQGLKKALAAENKTLVFAMNGGMFIEGLTPKGLYVERGKILVPLDTVRNGYGNFYLQPNGVFYLTKNQQPAIVQTTDFVFSSNIQYATQSGPMLLIDGQVHPKLRQGSLNTNIRNGVGILPDGKLLFVLSKDKINFYDFALFFKEKGCNNALYLDGAVSKMYLPAQQWEQVDGEFGVMIGEVKKKL